jgi:hypothetical protein
MRTGTAKSNTPCLDVMNEARLRDVSQKGKSAVAFQPTQIEEDPLAVYRFGGVKIIGDITSPVSDPRDWEYD